MASVKLTFKLPDGSTYSDSIGYSYFFGINPNVVIAQVKAITKVVGTLEDQQKKLNNLLAGTSRVGSISGDYIDYAYTDELVDNIKKRADWLQKTITKLKTARDNLQILVNEFNTRLNSLSDYEARTVAVYVLSGDIRNG